MSTVNNTFGRQDPDILRGVSFKYVDQKYKLYPQVNIGTGPLTFEESQLDDCSDENCYTFEPRIKRGNESDLAKFFLSLFFSNRYTEIKAVLESTESSENVSDYQKKMREIFELLKNDKKLTFIVASIFYAMENREFSYPQICDFIRYVITNNNKDASTIDDNALDETVKQIAKIYTGKDLCIKLIEGENTTIEDYWHTAFPKIIGFQDYWPAKYRKNAKDFKSKSLEKLKQLLDNYINYNVKTKFDDFFDKQQVENDTINFTNKSDDLIITSDSIKEYELLMVIIEAKTYFFVPIPLVLSAENDPETFFLIDFDQYYDCVKDKFSNDENCFIAKKEQGNTVITLIQEYLQSRNSINSNNNKNSVATPIEIFKLVNKKLQDASQQQQQELPKLSTEEFLKEMDDIKVEELEKFEKMEKERNELLLKKKIEELNIEGLMKNYKKLDSESLEKAKETLEKANQSNPRAAKEIMKGRFQKDKQDAIAAVESAAASAESKIDPTLEDLIFSEDPDDTLGIEAAKVLLNDEKNIDLFNKMNDKNKKKIYLRAIADSWETINNNFKKLLIDNFELIKDFPESVASILSVLKEKRINEGGQINNELLSDFDKDIIDKIREAGYYPGQTLTLTTEKIKKKVIRDYLDDLDLLALHFAKKNIQRTSRTDTTPATNIENFFYQYTNFNLNNDIKRYIYLNTADKDKPYIDGKLEREGNIIKQYLNDDNANYLKKVLTFLKENGVEGITYPTEQSVGGSKTYRNFPHKKSIPFLNTRRNFDSVDHTPLKLYTHYNKKRLTRNKKRAHKKTQRAP